MKKLIAIMMVLLMALAMVACSNENEPATKQENSDASKENTPSTGTNDSEFDPNATIDFEMQTSADNTVVTVGTIDKTLYAQPVLVTSFGQSTDAAMLETVMKRAKVNYTYDPVADASVVANYKTVIIAVGASTKGLGAAGISEADETARAEKIMSVIKENDIEVICCHIGGSSRRGVLSDVFADMVMAECSYIVLKEDANFDYKFTSYAQENDLPITLIFATKDTVAVFTELFA